MRVIGTIRPSTTERLTAEADTYEQARDELMAKIPEGYDLIALRVDRDITPAV